MLKQQHIYTMPESFLNDQSVPARWRILALVNGFLINEGKCWASNKWFMEKLKCSRPTISSGIQDLEDMGQIVCKRTKRSRIIERKVGLPLRGKLGSVSEESSFTPNSVSNSVSKSSASRNKRKKDMGFGYNENEHQEEVPSVDADSGETSAPEPRGAKRDTWKKLLSWAEQERGFKFLPNKISKQFKAFQIASKAGFTVGDLKKRWVEMSEDKFWSEKGFDWMDVVNSFNRKGK